MSTVKNYRPMRFRYKERGRSRKGPPEAVIVGKLSLAAGGFGFVMVKGMARDIFIPAQYVGSAMHGDMVKVEILPEQRRDDKRGPSGKIVGIAERGRSTLVGELLAGGKVRPLNKKISEEIVISGKLNGARRGDWVTVRLIHESGESGHRRGMLEERIGRAGEIIADLDAICREFDLPEPYSAAFEQGAAELKPRRINRIDLTRLFCVSIDPHDAKDHDDAISLAPGRNDGEVELGVHIADVAAWIVPGGKFDKAAARRAFTAYLPGRTLPMLPRGLTRNISLTPVGNSLAHSVIFTVHRESGRILSSKRCHSTVRLTGRLTYDQVQEFIDKGSFGDWNEEFSNNMRRLVDVFRNMRACRRKEEKFLELAMPEIRVLCDETKNEILGISRKVQREADELVEECMLAANTAVAIELLDRSIPGLFRVHPEPEPEKLEEFSAFAAAAFNLRTGDISNRAACNHFLEKLPDDEKRPVILGAFLRSLPRAHYLAQPAIHFGLGKTRYSHFTSPIRRYPDLLVHQQLWENEIDGRLRSAKTMEKFASDCSDKEEHTDEAWYAANDRLKLRYLHQLLMEGNLDFYDGIIARVTPGGLQVDIGPLGIYGFVPLDRLPGHFRKHGDMLVALRGGRSYKCGDRLHLQLSHIDFIKGCAVFQPTEPILRKSAKD